MGDEREMLLRLPRPMLMLMLMLLPPQLLVRWVLTSRSLSVPPVDSKGPHPTDSCGESSTIIDRSRGSLGRESYPVFPAVSIARFEGSRYLYS